jgi:predicted DCC family thiol-disulfide oxidoreductase YuxK
MHFATVAPLPSLPAPRLLGATSVRDLRVKATAAVLRGAICHDGEDGSLARGVEVDVNSTDGSADAPVLLYDGVCGVCNGAVRTILRFDRRGTLRFAALDGDFARDVLARHPQCRGVDSAVYVRNVGTSDESVDTQSAALLQIAAYLGGLWKLALVAHAIPAPVRDWLYGRFAAFRYRVGGHYDSCPIPPADVRSRFLDTAYD